MRFFYLKFQQPEKMMQLVRNNQLHKHLTNIDAEARLIARELANECAVEKNIHFEYMLEKRKQLEDEICRTLIFI